MYTEKVLDHFNNPRNVGEIEDANAIGESTSSSCGDSMKIWLRINNNVIEDVKFKTFGCAAAIASSSIATEMIKGKTVDEALQLTSKQIAEELGGLPKHKLHCSVLAASALKNAIEDYRKND